jgi:hypothetical protein
MRVEIFALCDYSAEYGGKMVVLGIFDTLFARELPAVHHHCCVAARLRFERIEEGQKRIRMTLSDADGKLVGPPIEMSYEVVASPEGHSATLQVIGNINGLRLEDYGEFSFDLAVNGRHEASIPLFVKPLAELPEQMRQHP